MTRPGDRTIDLISRLVGFDTVSRNSNLVLIDFVRDYLDGLGIASRLVPDPGGTKANLFATIGPEGRPGLVLSGHTDVVPVEDQDWSGDPFTAVEEEGRLFGRGTADMKSFIAVALALTPEFLKLGLKAPLHFAFSYDEEVGCIGVRGLLAALRDLEPRPWGCIVGEPTELKVATAHKGKTSMHCCVHGVACHSALAPSGVNAVEIAAELITYLRAMGRRFRAEGPFDPAFDPPHTTVHTGLVAGGTALNIVPSDCAFDFEFRTLPRQPAAPLVAEVAGFARRALLPEMQGISRATGIEWEEMAGFPGLETPEDAPVAQSAMQAAGANAAFKVSFGTEAGLYQQAGIPAVVCGPGSIAQAHAADEFVTLEQVARCEEFLRRLAHGLAGS